MTRVWSICGMCTVRCHIAVDVQDGEVAWIQGNPNAGMAGSICPRGAAGIALLKDTERPQAPMIRAGARGEGRWRKVSWDEALDYTAEKLKAVMDAHGPRSVFFSDRGGPFVDLHQAFVRGLGSPNYCNHDSSCARNTHHAANSVTGLGRKGVSYDLANARHVVLQTRNIFEAINVKEVKDLTAAMENGCRLSVVDVRATVTSAKAHDFYLVRPGTDHAFNLAVLHVLIRQGLYDKEYVNKYVKDFDKLVALVESCTPEWAARETGVPAGRIVALAHDLAEAAPAVIWHPGWNTARYEDSFHVARTAYLINALLGTIGAKGGLALALGPGDIGRKGLKKLADLYPASKERRADGVGWKLPHLDTGPGLLSEMLLAVETADPYPLKAYLCFRHDPLMAMPDPNRTKQLLDQLDFLASVSFSWSETAWYSDVILPLSPYLERESIVATKSGTKPAFFMRQRAVQPRYDTRAEWEIFCGLARRLGLDKLAFSSIEDIWNYQLDGTGVTITDFAKTGLVSLADKASYVTLETRKCKTPSGLLEVVAEKWDSAGVPSLKPYQAPPAPPEGRFRLVFGRCALHTQGHTVNNPLLHAIMPENDLWIHTAAAARLGVRTGDLVEVANGEARERVKARVTDLIHPECVFTVHGFGHRLPVESRAYGKGLADQRLMVGGLSLKDPAGGALALQSHFVSVTKV